MTERARKYRGSGQPRVKVRYEYTRIGTLGRGWLPLVNSLSACEPTHMCEQQAINSAYSHGTDMGRNGTQVGVMAIVQGKAMACIDPGEGVTQTVHSVQWFVVPTACPLSSVVLK